MKQRVILGANSTGFNAGTGLWVSKPGLDAGSSNFNDFLIAPNLNGAMGILSGYFAAGASLDLISHGADINVPIDTFGDYYGITPSIYRATVNHNLGYVPMVWSDIDVDTYYMPLTTAGTPGDPSFPYNIGYFVIYVDSTSVGIEFHCNMTTFQFYGSTTSSYPLATNITLSRGIHFAVMNVQVA